MNNQTKKPLSMNPLFIIRFAIIFLFVIFLVVAIVVSISQVRKTKDNVSLLNDEKSTYYMAETAHYKWATDLSLAINSGVEFKGSLDPTQCAFGKFIYDDSVQKNPSYKAFLDEIMPLHSEIHISAKDVLETSKSNAELAQIAYKDTILPKIASLVEIINTSIEEKNTLITTAENDLDRMIDIALIVCFISILAVLSACIETYFFIRREVINPICKLEDECKKLSAGELSLHFETNRKTREMQNLSTSLESSVKELQQYIFAINEAMSAFANNDFTKVLSTEFLGDFVEIQTAINSFQNNISDTFIQIREAANQVSSGSDQVSSGAQALAQGATEQASSVEELSASISEISSQVKQTADNSSKASSMSNDATNAITSSNEQMQKLMMAMDNINTKSSEISKIIKTIEDIAFQTNILALNAAVEAARAGAAGKGFAVVADEVRNLAGKSAEAAKNTTALIEDTVSSVEEGVKLAKITAKDLLGAVDSVKQTTDIISGITIASNEQASSIAQVTIGVDQISAVVQTNSATSEESAAASEELSSQASLLNELVSKFTLAENKTINTHSD